MWKNKMRLNKSINNNQGQALVELAVFGMVIIMLFVWMAGFGQNSNASQTFSMHSFRQAQKLARHRSKEEKEFGAVTFTTIAAINPVNPVKTKTTVSDVGGSASVMWENELFAFATPEEPEDVDQEDSPITYYQMGETMIRNNQAMIWPTMKVKRKASQDSRHYQSWFHNIFFQAVNAINEIQSGNFWDEQEYWSLESQPTWDTKKLVGEEYKVKEIAGESGGTAKLAETSRNEVTTTTTFNILPAHYIKAWDDEIVDGPQGLHDKVTITQKQKLEAMKAWTTPTQ